jgi:hypothetical protein
MIDEKHKKANQSGNIFGSEINVAANRRTDQFDRQRRSRARNRRPRHDQAEECNEALSNTGVVARGSRGTNGG